LENVPGVFVSYSRADRARVENLVKLLEAAGFKLWWDLDIPPGVRFDDFIREKLRASQAVLVIWSRKSAASDYVRGEAREAAAANKLVSATIDPWNDIKQALPLDFHGFEHADLSGWNGDTADHEFKLVLGSLERLTQSRSIVPPPPPLRPGYWMMLVGAALAAAVALWFLARGGDWRVSATDCEVVVQFESLQPQPDNTTIDYVEIGGQTTQRFPVADNKSIVKIDGSSVSNWILVIAWSDRTQTRFGPFDSCPRDVTRKSADDRAVVRFVTP
jgi:hypothetical protein